MPTCKRAPCKARHPIPWPSQRWSEPICNNRRVGSVSSPTPKHQTRHTMTTRHTATYISVCHHALPHPAPRSPCHSNIIISPFSHMRVRSSLAISVCNARLLQKCFYNNKEQGLAQTSRYIKFMSRRHINHVWSKSVM